MRIAGLPDAGQYGYSLSVLAAATALSSCGCPSDPLSGIACVPVVNGDDATTSLYDGVPLGLAGTFIPRRNSAPVFPAGFRLFWLLGRRDLAS